MALTERVGRGIIRGCPPIGGRTGKEGLLVDELTDRSAGRLRRLIAIIGRFKDECGSERTVREAIEALGGFRVGRAVRELVELVDHADEGHRATARSSLLRIRNAMGALWIDGSLTIIRKNAESAGDRRICRNALVAVVDCTGPELSLRHFLPMLRGPGDEDLRSIVRLAAKVPHFDIADRLMDIAFDASRDDVLRMMALESLAGTVVGLDADDLEYLELMLAVETVRLSEGRTDDDSDYMLARADEVFRVIHECLDDLAHGIDA